ncbi:hypothetical protein [Nodularia sphaerocarpa]|uniref:hypothetical protein n=1 Tax=Nodularia sphaerocarpa TaxID=137816 RepID=UPI001EFB9D58|nr:hypothetical protein [Nodularia sphaerocarpa]MDB9372829.1 hypothetical protein [Nodularia sphaerocarpa CS-585]MDB9377008.1 hypothetical protein [Nodularia sphaerocarpa CS-585A2]ULP71577.1 hypothetical protein BDGGKGIB_01208 [Nodularia sphaerocarpa UHCC 0038]
MKETITYEQLQAIKIVCDTNHWNRHFLDIRLSLPIPAIRLYIILLVAKERPAKRRWRYAKGVFPLRNPVNILFLLGLVIIFLISSFAIFTFVWSSIYSTPISPHPTSIPWINNQFDCERTYRIWKDGKCWDLEHSPVF